MIDAPLSLLFLVRKGLLLRTQENMITFKFKTIDNSSIPVGKRNIPLVSWRRL